MSEEKRLFPPAFFVSGTDTGIGKTVVSALLASGLNAAYWKPVQSGLEEQTDTAFVRERTGLPPEHFFPERYRLQTPMSPHASAEIDGVEIRLEDFQLPDFSSFDHLIVEGAGGLMVPLNDQVMIIDLIKKLDLPVLLVARSELGTLNHTFLSLDQLQRYGISCMGVIMNGEKHESNRRTIEYFGKVPVLAELEPMEQVGKEHLEKVFHRLFP